MEWGGENSRTFLGNKRWRAEQNLSSLNSMWHVLADSVFPIKRSTRKENCSDSSQSQCEIPLNYVAIKIADLPDLESFRKGPWP